MQTPPRFLRGIRAYCRILWAIRKLGSWTMAGCHAVRGEFGTLSAVLLKAWAFSTLPGWASCPPLPTSGCCSLVASSAPGSPSPSSVGGGGGLLDTCLLSTASPPSPVQTLGGRGPTRATGCPRETGPPLSNQLGRVT